MDYEKAYKEAIEKLRYKISDNNGNIDYKAIVNVEELQDIFPELKESEDEKIRKGIIELVKQSSEILDKKNQERMLAWLEKQGEQKPTLRERYENISKSEWFKRTHEGMSCGMITPEESLGMSSEEYNKVVSDCIFGDEKKPQVDSFDAELNALLKKYEYLPKKELQEPLEFYLGVVRDDLDVVREDEKPKWSEEDDRMFLFIQKKLTSEVDDWLESLKKRMEE